MVYQLNQREEKSMAKLPTPPETIRLSDIQAEYTALVNAEANKIKQQSQAVADAIAKIEADIMKMFG